ncbi:hypothetical protein Anas_03636 [Armadillidium nasatum]|uniref:Uncharacterized protein n=1 Tax=Armadillidium nasatum TaxID=96803 RepID=A0A5N5T8T6_9CRUS|nr:hypothetical protein Anas_03636 [Armadillidium nasatum]
MGSYIECLNSLLLNKQPLRSLAIDDDPLVSKVLTKPRKVEGFQRLFLPIAKTIKTVEGDEPHLSSVIQFLNSILEEVENTSIVTPLFKKEEADFVDIVKKRRSFCITSNIHLAANLLDPRYRGKDLSPTENVQAFQKVYNLSRETLDVDENKTPLSIALSQSLTPLPQIYHMKDEESDLSVEAMIGNRSEDSDAEAVEQEFNEALDGSLEIW